MRSLYRMSRTAGVGLQDYAAVNVLAVIGVLMAAASVLVLIFDDVTPMLLIPIGAFIVSLVAFIQIRKSNGTQTGATLALAGILISGGFMGTNAWGRYTQASIEHGHESQLRAITKTFSDDLIAGNDQGAYDLFDQRFRDSTGFESFDRTAKYLVSKMFGDKQIASMALGDRVFIDTDTGGLTTAHALLHVMSNAPGPNGQPLQTETQIEFHQIEGVWKIHAVSNWFDIAPTPRAKSAGGA